MADNGNQDDDLAGRFPRPPSEPEIPEAPKIDVKLPPREGRPTPGAVKPGAYRKVAIAATAASTFITPIIVLSLGGWWLDQRMHSSTGIFAFLGALVGFVVGIISLLRVIQQLNS